MAFFLLLFFLNPAFSEEENDDSILKSTMRKILNDPRVKPTFETCKSRHQNGTAENIENCLFEQLTKSDPQALDFIVQLLDQVKAEAQQNQNRENASKFSGKGLGTIKLRNDPVLKKIREQMSDKILETVFGDKGSLLNENELRVVDQKTFFELYRSHLSKGFTDVVAGFCININMTNVKIDPISKSITRGILTYDEDNQKKNMADLKNNKAKEQGEIFIACIKAFKLACSFKESNGSCPTLKTLGPNGVLTDRIGGNDTAPFCSADEPTQQKACEVLQYAEEIKQNIIASEKLLKKWEELNKDAGDGAMLRVALGSGQRVKQYNGTTRAGDGSKSIQELTITTSKDIENTLGKGQNDLYAKAGEELATKCAQNNDAEGCDEIVLNQQKFDKQKEEIVEIGTRMRAMEHRLQKSLEKISTGDQDAKDNLKTLLKEEGFEDAVALNIINDDEKSKKVVADILQSYKAKRESLIKSMSKRLENKSPTNFQGRIGKIKKRYKNKTKKMVELVHYSNIVASFLTVEKGDGTKSVNVFRAKQELKGLSSDLEGNRSSIEGSIQSPGQGKQVKNDAEGSLNLQVERINEILLKDTKQDEAANGRQAAP